MSLSLSLTFVQNYQGTTEVDQLFAPDAFLVLFFSFRWEEVRR